MPTSMKEAPGARKSGGFARFLAAIRYRLRRLFGKKDDPNIYPFF